MKYFLIMGLTMFSVWTIINILDKRGITEIGKLHSQSTIYESIKNFIPKPIYEKPAMVTQSMKNSQKNMIKVLMDGQKAYWFVENVFYTADTINGRVDQSTIKPLDIDSLSKNELNKLMDILDALGMGRNLNDNGSSGN